MSYLNISLKNEVEIMISARSCGVRGIGRERWVRGYKGGRNSSVLLHSIVLSIDNNVDTYRTGF